MRAGDGLAFEALVTAHGGSLRRMARTFVRTPDAADEVVQETWLGVVRGVDSFEGRSSLRTWIFDSRQRGRTRAAQDARSVPFSSLEVDDEPALEASAFAADGSWASAPPRLDADPEGALLVRVPRAPARGGRRATAGPAGGHHAARHRRRPAEEVCELLDIGDGNQRVLLHRARTRVRVALASLVEGQA